MRPTFVELNVDQVECGYLTARPKLGSAVLGLQQCVAVVTVVQKLRVPFWVRVLQAPVKRRRRPSPHKYGGGRADTLS